MGKITLTVEGSTVGTVAEGRGFSRSKTVSEEDSARIVRVYAGSFANKFTNPDGTLRQPSIDEVLAAWFDDIVASTLNHVAVIEARAAVQPITVT